MTALLAKLNRRLHGYRTLLVILFFLVMVPFLEIMGGLNAGQFFENFMVGHFCGPNPEMTNCFALLHGMGANAQQVYMTLVAVILAWMRRHTSTPVGMNPCEAILNPAAVIDPPPTDTQQNTAMVDVFTVPVTEHPVTPDVPIAATGVFISGTMPTATPAPESAPSDAPANAAAATAS